MMVTLEGHWEKEQNANRHETDKAIIFFIVVCFKFISYFQSIALLFDEAIIEPPA